MAIERISSSEGLEIPKSSDPNVYGHVAIAGLISGMAIEQTLLPGEYDITPTVWTKNLLTHTIIVNSDGTGIYRGFPREDEVGIAELDGQELDFKKGGRIIRLPQDQKVLVIAGPKRNTPKILLFELILHHA